MLPVGTDILNILALTSAADSTHKTRAQEAERLNQDADRLKQEAWRITNDRLTPLFGSRAAQEVMYHIT